MHLVGGNEVEEVSRRDVVLSSQSRHEVLTDVDDRLVYVDVMLDDGLPELARDEAVVGRYQLGRHGQQRLVGPREQPVDTRVVHHAGEVATSPATADIEHI